MTDLEFVMCNLKLNENQVKNHADNFNEDVNYLSSDDDWIIEGEIHQNLMCLVLLIVQHKEKMVKKIKVMKKKFLMMLKLRIMVLDMI